MPETLTQTDFLMARIAEDEEDIRSRSRGRPIHYSGCYYYNASLDANWHCDCDEWEDPVPRQIADIEAKRQIVEELRAAEVEWGASRGPQEGGEVNGLLRAVALLAAVDADHPDFHDEWRP